MACRAAYTMPSRFTCNSRSISSSLALVQLLGQRDPRVAEEDVDRAVALHARVDRALGIGAAGDVRFDDGADAAGALDLALERLRLGDLAVRQHEPCALAREAQRTGAPDPRARAGDDGRLAGEPHQCAHTRRRSASRCRVSRSVDARSELDPKTVGRRGVIRDARRDSVATSSPGSASCPRSRAGSRSSGSGAARGTALMFGAPPGLYCCTRSTSLPVRVRSNQRVVSPVSSRARSSRMKSMPPASDRRP